MTQGGPQMSNVVEKVPVLRFVRDSVWPWAQTHPVSAGIFALYFLGLLVVMANAKAGVRDEISVGSYLALGALLVFVIAITKWSFGVVFAME